MGGEVGRGEERRGEVMATLTRREKGQRCAEKVELLSVRVLENRDNYAACICKGGKLLVITVVRTFIELYLSGRKSRCETSIIQG